MITSYYNKTPRVTVRRRAGRGAYDRQTVEAILDDGLVAHVGFTVDGQPYVIPVLYVRVGETIYLHGSPLSRLIGGLADGWPVCLAVTLTDGLVLARSAFHHSVNYRSVVVLGDARPVREREAKLGALRALVDHVVPGRAQDARGPDEQELAATEVVALAIREASAKVRSGPPVDAGEDYELPVWAGEVPVALVAGEPRPDDRCAVALPGYLRDYVRLSA